MCCTTLWFMTAVLFWTDTLQWVLPSFKKGHTVWHTHTIQRLRETSRDVFRFLGSLASLNLHLMARPSMFTWAAYLGGSCEALGSLFTFSLTPQHYLYHLQIALLWLFYLYVNRNQLNWVINYFVCDATSIYVYLSSPMYTCSEAVYLSVLYTVYLSNTIPDLSWVPVHV